MIVGIETAGSFTADRDQIPRTLDDFLCECAPTTDWRWSSSTLPRLWEESHEVWMCQGLRAMESHALQ
jgi:hypothetical protein